MRRNSLGPIARRSTLLLAVAMAMIALVAPGAAELPKKVGMTTPEMGGPVGEAEAIRQRYRLELQLRGISPDGEGARSLLRQARKAYAEYRLGEGSFRTMGTSVSPWISLGPNNGAGRFTAVTPHPTIQGTVLAGAAGGGVWRTRNGGSTWEPLTDGIPNLSVGALAIAPSNPDIVYLGTGEGGYGIDFIPGIGMLRSDDGGDTWSLPEEVIATQFFRINVDPRNPNVLLAATNEGLLRSETGGATWSTVISAYANTGSRQLLVTDVIRSERTPDRLYAALWCLGSCPSGKTRIMKSTDNGKTWSKAATGLPSPISDRWDLNRTAIAISPSNDRILYVALNLAPARERDDPPVNVYRTTDRATTWKKVKSPEPYLGAQGWYDNTITVGPSDPNRVVAGGVYYVVSRDGGQKWATRNPYAGTKNLPHVDAHDLQWQGDTLWVACDGGIWKSNDNGITWIDANNGLVTRQYYGLAIDPADRELVLAGSQDNGTNQRRSTGDNAWDMVLGGDGFECAINPLIPTIRYGTIYNTNVYRALPGEGFRDISPAFGSDENPPFITPLTLNPSRPGEVLTGTSRVWRSPDGGDAWVPVPTEMEEGETWNDSSIWSIAMTAADPKVLMVAKYRDLYRSENGGATWKVTHFGQDGLPRKRVVNVEISPFDADIALACLASLDGDSLWRTTDGGLTWQQSTDGLRPFTAQVARWDPTDASVVYLGTDVGLYRSTDGGLSWSRFGSALPAVSVHDIRALEDGSMLRAATHGRGVWELDIPSGSNTPPSITITSPGDTIQLNAGQSAHFAATATDSDGDPITVTWTVTDLWETEDGGSGTGSLQTSFTHTFPMGGRFYATATVRDAKGGMGLATLMAEIDEPADSCAAPRVIPAAGPFPVEYLLNNGSGGIDESDPAPSCVEEERDDNVGRWGSTWFELTPDEDGSYAISTCGSGSDTVLSVWTGPACGPYTELTGGCNDDDEMVHCSTSRSNSYLELDLDGGTTYRIMVGAYRKDARGRFNLQVDCLSCQPTTLETHMVTAAAHLAGQNGTHWVSDVDLFNPSDTDVAVQAAWLPSGHDNSNVGTTGLLVPAGRSLALADVVQGTFGARGAGAIRLESGGPLLIASRTYNDAPAGTFGQFIAGRPAADSIGAGGQAILAGLVRNTQYRTNIGIANVSGSTAAVAIDLHGPDGAVLATRDLTLPPWGWEQVTDIFGAEGITDIDAAFATVRNGSGDAAVQAYASVVDNRTGDPTYITPAQWAALPSEPLWIAASAHVTGVGGSTWRTDLFLVNQGTENASVTIDLLPADQDNTSHGQTQVALPAGTSRHLEDVLANLFGFTGSAALRISTDAGRIAVTSRTFNLSTVGTLGQYVPALPANKALTSELDGYLIQLRRNEAFRTNVGVANLTEEQVKVRVDYFRADGTSMGHSTYTVPPLSFHQHTKALPGTEAVTGGFARITSQTPGARYLAYASVVDEGSGDPVYMPAWSLVE